MKLMRHSHGLGAIGACVAIASCGVIEDPQSELEQSSHALFTPADDREPTIRSVADIHAKRAAFIDFIWGGRGFPTSSAVQLAKNIPSPVSGLSNLKRVDEIRVNMEANQQSLGYHFIPDKPNGRLVVFSPGHVCTFNDAPDSADVKSGEQRTIKHLLVDGYAVYALFMPLTVPGVSEQECGLMTGKHNTLIGNPPPGITGSPLKFFLEPVAVGLNYLRSRSVQDGFPQYEDVYMTGLSGGGWTTVVYAAIDPSIRKSVHVAGSLPLYVSWAIGDAEQKAFSHVVSYVDLYLMGSHGPGRRQTQVLLRKDDCCFGPATGHPPYLTDAGITWEQAIRSYEKRVREIIIALGSGTFRLEIDEAAPGHMFSWHTIVDTILAEFNDARRYVAAANGTDAFVRGMDGNLHHHGASGWTNTGFPLVGTAAVTHGVVNAHDVFYRDPSNKLVHAWSSGNGTWQKESMGGIANSDPVAVGSGGQNHVVALGTNYLLYRWTKSGSTWSFSRIDSSFKGLGVPALVSVGTNKLEVFTRGWDRVLYQHSYNGSSWSGRKTVGGIVLDSPSAVVENGNLRVYTRGREPNLFEVFKSPSGSWQWANLSVKTGTTGHVGSPSAVLRNGKVQVFMRTLTDSLTSFTLGSTWTVTPHGGAMTGSPTATAGGAFVRGTDRGLSLFNGTSWVGRQGVFD